MKYLAAIIISFSLFSLGFSQTANFPFEKKSEEQQVESYGFQFKTLSDSSKSKDTQNEWDTNSWGKDYFNTQNFQNPYMESDKENQNEMDSYRNFGLPQYDQSEDRLQSNQNEMDSYRNFGLPPYDQSEDRLQSNQNEIDSYRNFGLPPYDQSEDRLQSNQNEMDSYRNYGLPQYDQSEDRLQSNQNEMDSYRNYGLPQYDQSEDRLQSNQNEIDSYRNYGLPQYDQSEDRLQSNHAPIDYSNDFDLDQNKIDYVSSGSLEFQLNNKTDELVYCTFYKSEGTMQFSIIAKVGDKTSEKIEARLPGKVSLIVGGNEVGPFEIEESTTFSEKYSFDNIDFELFYRGGYMYLRNW